ncbi:carbohydrate sulfotransferase 9-like isoform X2 [Acanthaster planci]|nr:carbohydrate sulfotransferase 9-like isoform X2 [Acanthaster planci]XP_022109259.1 carbohydrate sulfotransferase 9-like isoform X2 [Acanthaster planci]XP_022109260.1 carbohydrate sulfotransferase 9-like isoform X2 [Acanthaster planci]
MSLRLQSVHERSNNVCADQNFAGSVRRRQSLTKMNSGQSSEPDSHFMREQALVQLRRQKRLRDICRQHPLAAQEVRHASQVFILEKTKILYCSLPKTGSTNWKRAFMVLEGVRSNVANISAYDAHWQNDFELLAHTHLLDRLRSHSLYTKFLHVRHPFARLISAYRDKISGEATREGQDPKFTDIAVYIVRKYRKGAGGEDFDPNTIHVTWGEWIQYLTDPTELSRFDPHWREMYKLCLPCRVNYDVVAKLETVESDSRFLLNYLELKQLSFPSSAHRYPSHDEKKGDKLVEQYFGNMSRSNFQRLYNIYKLDFELFGYEKPFLF